MAQRRHESLPSNLQAVSAACARQLAALPIQFTLAWGTPIRIVPGRARTGVNKVWTAVNSAALSRQTIHSGNSGGGDPLYRNKKIGYQDRPSNHWAVDCDYKA
jgi:hypothetical protein